MLQQALDYIKKGKSIIPLRKDKRPYLTEWREFQGRYATEQEVKDWWGKWPDANIGLITGRISGITVLDVDTPHGGTIDGLPITLVAKTGNGGWHYYYKYAEGVTVGAGIRQGIDFRGDGGYVVAPPSVTEYTDKDGNKKGGKYEYSWVQELEDFPIDLFPVNRKQTDWKKVLQGVGEGERNMTTASLAGKLLASFKKHEWESIAWPMLQMWNKNNTPPDDEKTVRRTFESMMKKHIIGQPEEKTEEIKIVTIKEAAEMQEKHEKIATGFTPMDEAMGGGLSTGSSIVIAAPSGEGKTAFMVSWSCYLLKKDYSCLWFSYEENIDDIWERFKITGIGDNIPAFCPLDLADNKLNFIEEVIKIQKQKHGNVAVFIDQLSYLAPKVDEKTDVNRIQANYALYLGKICDQIKTIAKDNKVLIFFAHQLGRSGEVAYSDMIKHAADKVIYIKRVPDTSKDAKDEFTDTTYVLFKKNRPLGTRPKIPMTVKDGMFIKKTSDVDLMVEYAKKIMPGTVEVDNLFND